MWKSTAALALLAPWQLVHGSCPTVASGDGHVLDFYPNPVDTHTKCYNANGQPIESLICSPANSQHPCCVQHNGNNNVNCYSRETFTAVVASGAPQTEDIQCAPTKTTGQSYSAIDCFPPTAPADCCSSNQVGHFSRCIEFKIPENHYYPCTCPSCTAETASAAECTDCCTALPRWNCAAEQKNALSTAAIVGITAGAIVFVAAAALVLA